MARKYRGSAVPLPDMAESDIVDLFRAYAALTGKALTAICRDASGDDKLIWDLQGGRKIGKDMRANIITHMQSELHRIDAAINEFEQLLSASMLKA